MAQLWLLFIGAISVALNLDTTVAVCTVSELEELRQVGERIMRQLNQSDCPLGQNRYVSKSLFARMILRRDHFVRAAVQGRTLKLKGKLRGR